MITTATSFQLLYISRLVPAGDFRVVRKIVEVARRMNPARGISGALLFDGERFCQLLEGSEISVRGLMGRIEIDPRHANVRVLQAGAFGDGLMSPRWASGYCGVHDLDGLDTTAAAVLSPIHQFSVVLNRADIV